jgi:hypothetical protein
MPPTVLGTIRDTSGAVVPRCKVTLENVSTGIAAREQLGIWRLFVQFPGPADPVGAEAGLLGG